VLVLSREKDQTISIGPDIVVMVVEVRGDKVRLGISAPKSVPVDRGEIARSKAEDGTLNISPPAGVFKTGWIMQVGDMLLWSPYEDLSRRVDLSDVVAWRFPDSVHQDKRLAKVGPEGDAKR
jgi:carbon storage regulator